MGFVQRKVLQIFYFLKIKNKILNFFRLSDEIEKEIGHSKSDALKFLEFFRTKVDSKNEGIIKVISFKKSLNNREWDDFLEQESDEAIKKSEESVEKPSIEKIEKSLPKEIESNSLIVGKNDQKKKIKKKKD
jgi:hypothetical protein